MDFVVTLSNQDTNPYRQFIETHGSLASLAGEFRQTVRSGARVVFEDGSGFPYRCLTTQVEVDAWEAEQY